MSPSVYEPHVCVCVLDSSRKGDPRTSWESEIARRRYESENTHAVAVVVAVSVLLLLLLERIRNVVVVVVVRQVRIRSVYEVLAGGVR